MENLEILVDRIVKIDASCLACTNKERPYRQGGSRFRGAMFGRVVQAVQRIRCPETGRILPPGTKGRLEAAGKEQVFVCRADGPAIGCVGMLSLDWIALPSPKPELVDMHGPLITEDGASFPDETFLPENVTDESEKIG